MKPDEDFENRPYKKLDRIDYHLRPGLSDGWAYPRCATSLVSVRGPIPLPMGPGTFPLHFLVEDMIKAIEVKYEFKAGREAEIQGDEEGAPKYKISAPKGHIIMPVGKAREWVIHLPVGTRVHAYIDKWQHDLEAMARQPKWDLTPEIMEEARRLLEEARKRREEG